MASPGPSTTGIGHKTALIVGISNDRLPGNAMQIGCAVAEVLHSEGYDVYLVGATKKDTDNCSAALKSECVRNDRVFTIHADMNNEDSILAAIPEICARQYNFVIFNAHYDPPRPQYSGDPISPVFKMNVLNHWLIAHHLIEKTIKEWNPDKRESGMTKGEFITEFIILPSVPKGLSAPSNSRRLPMDRLNQFFAPSLVDVHYYTKLASIAMKEYLKTMGRPEVRSKPVLAEVMYPADVDEEEEEVDQMYVEVPAKVRARKPKENPWGRRVYERVIKGWVNKNHWLKGENEVEEKFEEYEIKAFGKYLEKYAKDHPRRTPQ